MEAKRGIEIISGVNEALNFKKKNPKASEERVMDNIIKFLKRKKIQGEQQVEIIAGVSSALGIIERNPKISERELINRIMQDIKK